MARNEEKALTMFNKWQTFKKDYHAGEQNRRPLVSAECQSLPEAEKFRREIVQNISKKIAIIQNGRCDCVLTMCCVVLLYFYVMLTALSLS